MPAGGIPKELGDLPALQWLDLSSNELSGKFHSLSKNCQFPHGRLEANSFFNFIRHPSATAGEMPVA